MATVTEQDIINHLQEKIKFHQTEAKRLATILSAFDITPETPRSKKSEQDDVENILQPLTSRKTAGRKPKIQKTKAIRPAKILEIPTSYTDDLTVNSKIAFALSQIGSGFNEDIAEEIAKYEPKSDAKKISKQISGILSTLKTKGQLKAEKSGRKDKFSLA